MTTVTVHNKFTEILASFGDLQESVNAAVQRYTSDQITTKINELRRKDEEFVRNVEANVSKTWEADLADWEFCHKGVEDWTKKLQDILLK